MAGLIFKPLSSDLYAIPKAHVFAKPVGAPDDAYTLLGDTDEVSLDITVEETERYTNEAGIRILAKTIVTQVDAALNMTLVQLSDLNRALSLMGALEYYTQAADPGATLNIADVDHDGKIYPLGALNVTNVSILDGGAVPYVLNTHYRLDAKGGFVQFIAMPGGADGDAVVTFDAPAIVEADKIARIGIGNQTENRFTIQIRGTNEVGPKTLLQLHDVQVRPSGGRSYISETDLDTIELTGRVFRDDNQPTGLELGFETTIPA